MIELTDDDIANIAHDDYDTEKYKVVFWGPWEDEGKYSHQQIVFQVGEEFYGFWISRSGSYFSDYDYQYPSVKDVQKVQKVTKTIEVWESIK